MHEGDAGELLRKYGFVDKDGNPEEEVIELASARKGGKVYGGTGYPKPHHRYQIQLEDFRMSLEEIYFWELEWVTTNQGYPKQWIKKIKDVFSASEQSSFFGAAWQRIGLQQDKVSQFLATVGKMVKEVFQLVREIRIIDERLAYYNDSYRKGPGSDSAEITLKGIWIDLVEQGSKNPASVYGMARELQFIVLPDLFFKYHPQTAEEVEQMVDRIEFNAKVKEVLKRKLRSYIEWKKHTFSELKTKRIFTLRYLRQHYDIIQMYLAWVRPYLQNIRRMHLADRTSSPELVNAFETSLIELEFLAKKFPQSIEQDLEPKINEHVHSVVIATFDFRTKPQMNYQQDYQRGPIHVGMVDMQLRGYAWTQKEIDNYIKMREEEDMELIGEIDSSIKAAMQGMGDELKKYLEEAQEDFSKKYNQPVEGGEKGKKPKLSGDNPFAALFGGFGEIFTSFRSNPKEKRPKSIDKWTLQQERKVAQREVKTNVWYLYKDFKKTHGMLSW
jgi:hypothetical protein